MCRCGTQNTTWYVANSMAGCSSDSGRWLDYEEGANPLTEMECNLEVITWGVPEYATIDEVPLRW